MKKLSVVLIICFLLSFLLPAQAFTAEAKTTFKAGALLTAIQEQLQSKSSSFTAQELAKIENLYFYDYSKAIDLAGIQSLKNLKSLYVSSESLKNFSQISKLTKLQALEASVFNSSAQQEDFSFLKNTRGFYTLRLSGFKIKNLSFLNALTSLEILALRNVSAPDYSSIFNCKKLTTLDLWDIPLKDLSPIQSLKQLKSVDLSNIGPHDFSKLSALSNLTDITLDLASKPVKNKSWRFLSSLKNLEHLSLYQMNAMDFSELKSSASIRSITLGKVKPKSLIPLADIPNLRRLSLIEMGLKDLTGISKLLDKPTFEQLRITDDAISNIDALKGKVHLASLDIENTKVSNIKVISTLNNLESLNLKDNQITDFSPINALRNLKTLNITGNKATNYNVLADIYADLTEKDFSMTVKPNPSKHHEGFTYINGQKYANRITFGKNGNPIPLNNKTAKLPLVSKGSFPPLNFDLNIPYSMMDKSPNYSLVEEATGAYEGADQDYLIYRIPGDKDIYLNDSNAALDFPNKKIYYYHDDYTKDEIGIYYVELSDVSKIKHLRTLKTSEIPEGAHSSSKEGAMVSNGKLYIQLENINESSYDSLEVNLSTFETKLLKGVEFDGDFIRYKRIFMTDHYIIWGHQTLGGYTQSLSDQDSSKFVEFFYDNGLSYNQTTPVHLGNDVILYARLVKTAEKGIELRLIRCDLKEEFNHPNRNEELPNSDKFTNSYGEEKIYHGEVIFKELVKNQEDTELKYNCDFFVSPDGNNVHLIFKERDSDAEKTRFKVFTYSLSHNKVTFRDSIELTEDDFGPNDFLFYDQGSYLYYSDLKPVKKVNF